MPCQVHSTYTGMVSSLPSALPLLIPLSLTMMVIYRVPSNEQLGLRHMLHVLFLIFGLVLQIRILRSRTGSRHAQRHRARPVNGTVDINSQNSTASLLPTWAQHLQWNYELLGVSTTWREGLSQSGWQSKSTTLVCTDCVDCVAVTTG